MIWILVLALVVSIVYNIYFLVNSNKEILKWIENTNRLIEHYENLEFMYNAKIKDACIRTHWLIKNKYNLSDEAVNEVINELNIILNKNDFRV